MRSYRFLLPIISVLFFCSCEQEPEKIVVNPFDSSYIITPSIIPKTQDTYTFQFSCGTADLAHKMFEEINWASEFKKRMIIKQFLIKKKNVYKFINLINQTDSFRILNFRSLWLDYYNEKEVNVASNGIYVSSSFYPNEIYALKTGINDSVPFQLIFTTNADNRIIMSIETDSSVYKTITKILTSNKLASPMTNN